jgi:hypothetical protein
VAAAADDSEAGQVRVLQLQVIFVAVVVDDGPWLVRLRDGQLSGS